MSLVKIFLIAHEKTSIRSQFHKERKKCSDDFAMVQRLKKLIIKECIIMIIRLFTLVMLNRHLIIIIIIQILGGAFYNSLSTKKM